MKTSTSKKHGFTLTEVVIVVAIIGLLPAKLTTAKSKHTKRRSQGKSLSA